MKTLNPILGALMLGLCAVTFSAHSQTGATATTHGNTVMTEDQIDAKYDADQKRCDQLKGNEEDVCEKKAKADRDSAKADLKQAKEGAEARHDADKEKMKAQYEVAKEKCDAMSGDAKDTCIANAKTQYHQ